MSHLLGLPTDRIVELSLAHTPSGAIQTVVSAVVGDEVVIHQSLLDEHADTACEWIVDHWQRVTLIRTGPLPHDPERAVRYGATFYLTLEE